jgi:hypothetical protein
VFLNLKCGVLSNEEMNDMAKELELVANRSLRRRIGMLASKDIWSV